MYILKFITQQDAFLRIFSPVFNVIFDEYVCGRGGRGQKTLPAKIFEVYNPKRCIFKAFPPFFSSLFLPLFYFFSLTLPSPALMRTRCQ